MDVKLSPAPNALDIIGREQMRESKAFDEIMEEGRIERGRKDVLQAIELRFGKKVADECRAAIEAISDEEELSESLRLAIKSRRPAELRRALSGADKE